MPAVAAQTDRRFRRAHVKPGRSAVRRHAAALSVLRVIAVLADHGVRRMAWHRAGSWRAGAAVSRDLAPRQPAIVATARCWRSSTRFAAATSCRSIWRSGERRLLASPWVEDAHVRRVLPSRVDIEIRERQPIGIGRLSGIALSRRRPRRRDRRVRTELRRSRPAAHRRPGRNWEPSLRREGSLCA